MAFLGTTHHRASGPSYLTGVPAVQIGWAATDAKRREKARAGDKTGAGTRTTMTTTVSGNVVGNTTVAARTVSGEAEDVKQS